MSEAPEPTIGEIIKGMEPGDTTWVRGPNGSYVLELIGTFKYADSWDGKWDAK